MPAPLIEFTADDPERARRFWRGVLGTELEPRPAEAGFGWELEDDCLRLGVHERGPGPGDTASLPYFSVGDLAAALDLSADRERAEQQARAATPEPQAAPAFG
jgi:catechol 2,3-dioxygenase-like lactoylglutathione lyase family enzyme